jgi:hypothetical protein
MVPTITPAAVCAGADSITKSRARSKKPRSGGGAGGLDAGEICAAAAELVAALLGTLGVAGPDALGVVVGIAGRGTLLAAVGIAGRGVPPEALGAALPEPAGRAALGVPLLDAAGRAPLLGGAACEPPLDGGASCAVAEEPLGEPDVTGPAGPCGPDAPASGVPLTSDVPPDGVPPGDVWSDGVELELLPRLVSDSASDDDSTSEN